MFPSTSVLACPNSRAGEPLSSSTQRAASPAEPEEGAPGPAQTAAVPAAVPVPVAVPVPAAVPVPVAVPVAVPAGRPGNWPATAALICGILGGAVVTIPAALVLGALGLRRAGPAGRGRARCWLAIGLALVWAGAVGYLLPHLIRAADPGCEAYKNNALTSYNRVAADVNNGADRAVLTRDVAAAVRQTGRAARDSENPAAARSLAALSSGLHTMLTDIRAGRIVPRQVLLGLNQDTDTADDVCGTV